MVTVITTVGTSIFSNYMDTDKNENINERPSGIEGYLDEIKKADVDLLLRKDSDFNIIKDKVKKPMKAWIEKNPTLGSAEIKSLVKIQEKLKDNLEVYLLCTDTSSSNLAAEIIKESINYNSIKIKKIISIEGLEVKNSENFEKVGFPRLTSSIKSILNETSNKCICNITGGYKALIPFMTIYGQLFEIPLFYIYEDSDNLIEIPLLPIKFDWLFTEKYFSYIPKEGDKWSENANDKNTMEDLEVLYNLNFIKKVGSSQYESTILGNFFKEYADKNISIHPSVLGKFVEYKLFEFIYPLIDKNKSIAHSSKILNNNIFNKEEVVKKYLKTYFASSSSPNIQKEIDEIINRNGHKYKNGNDHGTDIDLLITCDDRNNNTYEIIEVKSFNQYRDEYIFYTSLIPFFIRHFNIIKNYGKVPSKYILYLYTGKSSNKLHSDIQQQWFIDRKNKIAELLKDEFDSCEFDMAILMINMDLKENEKNWQTPYGKLFDNKINKDDIIFIHN